jgi:hypothetical protein
MGTHLNYAVEVVTLCFENYVCWICEVRLARESRYFYYFFYGLLVDAVLKPGTARQWCTEGGGLGGSNPPPP